jgi:hypothetical protein
MQGTLSVFTDIKAILFLTASGSRRIQFGGGCAKLHEPGSLTASNRYRPTWERECIDLAELARLRWIERWKIERIAEHLKVGTTSVKRGLRSIESNPELAKIEFGHRKRRPWAVGKVFRGK